MSGSQKKLAIGLLILALSIGLLPALTTPVPSVLAIKLDNDLAINIAAKTLKQHTPNIKIIEYGSLQYQLLLWRTVYPTIWISHGEKQGVQIQGQLKPWSALEAPIKQSPSKDIILACHSNGLIENTSLKRSDVATFNTDIDAVLGALLISYVFSGNKEIITAIMDRTSYLLSSPETFTPLSLSACEMGYWIIIAIITFWLIVLDFCMDPEWNIVQTTALKLITFGKIGILTTLIWLANGWINLSSAFSAIVGFILDAAGYLIDAFNAASFWEKLLFGLSFAVAVACLVVEITATAGQSIWWKVAAATVTVITLGAGIASDYYDSNDYVG